MQMELTFDSQVTLRADGSLVVTPGKPIIKGAEDWRKLAQVMRDSPAKMPYRDRHDMVGLLVSGLVRGRRIGARGHWSVEMNSLDEFMRSQETGS